MEAADVDDTVSFGSPTTLFKRFWHRFVRPRSVTRVALRHHGRRRAPRC
jgi:hypothetical protein